MSRALGFHRLGERVAYAVVDREPDAAPTVVDAGEVTLGELRGLHRLWRTKGGLSWALAEERDGFVVERPFDDWPLRRPEVRCLLHPVDAAAHWEWELGRISEDDLFLWLRPERLLWSRGMPGEGRSGSEARRGPLRESLERALGHAGGTELPVAVATDRHAPGAELLREELQRAGHRIRPLTTRPEERHADRAAAGAALAALEPHRAGALPPARTRGADPLVTVASVVSAAAILTSMWLGNGQRADLERASAAEPGLPAPAERDVDVRAAAPLPAAVEELLLRRRAAVRGVEALLEGAAAASLEEFEVLAAPGSPRASLRVLFAEGAGAPEVESLPPGITLAPEPGSARTWKGQARSDAEGGAQ